MLSDTRHRGYGFVIINRFYAMKLEKLSLLAVLAAFSVPVTAQQAEAMHGYLRDAWGRPVEGAEIKALGSGAFLSHPKTEG